MRTSLILLLLLIANHLLAQHIFSDNVDKWSSGIGYTGASLNTSNSVAGGLAVNIKRNIFQTPTTSFSLSTSIKLGIEDKIASGALIPLIILAGSSSGNNNDNSNGGKIHLFTEVPLLLHFNYGLGANNGQHDPRVSGIYSTPYKRFGFYFGGGMSYTMTGYTDTSGLSKRTSFFGVVLDGGIRFKSNVDINFAKVFPLSPIGQINNPAFYEITLSGFF